MAPPQAGSVFTDRVIKRFLSEARHGAFESLSDDEEESIVPWRPRDRMKTVSVALVMCLNIPVDPPDVIRTQPCARLLCWIDPASMPPQKALEAIGRNLQMQYERWQSRARYKQSLDPTHEDVRKLCLSMRRSAKDERVLLHYAGHGVPRPTANGEIWVFNRNYTQYIPLAVYDLHAWLGSPSVLVIDSSAAGVIVEAFAALLRHHWSGRVGGPDSVILLAACGANESLPTSPELPADLFTACLTTPIHMALRFCCNSPLSNVTVDMIDRIPGHLSDRRTPLGELNWIFTAITDTIAWNSLPQPLFQKLFRQDLLLASLFRNFLLAERIARFYNCRPVSLPRLPPTQHHHMWDAWELAAEACLAQLPALLAPGAGPRAPFRFSSFFAEQLTAFEVWLQIGARNRQTPEQLPIVLQVSTTITTLTHRLRALLLLGRFVAIGPWAVNLALSVGIFPYILRLLQSPAAELRVVLVFIWSKIVALDRSCQQELVKDGGHAYFISLLHGPTPQVN
ncbi:raptor N-terminal caspase like domain-containing protein [Pavlovales sp. CCMP2436]|nr:raptor N-terminal caspase like domain-containing protein [Pavlovales sp. CCMP2436]